jgi:putative ABC transport system substrate-binding protein
MKLTGFVEGTDVVVEYRWADNDQKKLAAFAAELANKPVDVLVTGGGLQAALAAKAATSAVPIVFSNVVDPIRSGLVESLRQPGTNITGNAGLTSELDAKRLKLLRELTPKASTIAVLANPSRPGFQREWLDLANAGKTLGVRLLLLPITSASEIRSAFEQLSGGTAQAILVSADPLFFDSRTALLGEVHKVGLPAMYYLREFSANGGLISYGPNLADLYQQSGLYAGRILKGESPASLPVEQPSRLALVINLKTAKALGITISGALLARADEVIE